MPGRAVLLFLPHVLWYNEIERGWSIFPYPANFLLVINEAH